jgi:hypothetical protein
MNWAEQMVARVEAMDQFDEIVTAQGNCLCVYCLEYADYAKPSYGGSYPDVWYQCFHCHAWTRSLSGYCIYCATPEIGEQELIKTLPKEPVSKRRTMRGTKLWARYRILLSARKAKGIVYWEGNGYPRARFRHETGKWFVLPDDLALAMKVMETIAEYARWGIPGLLSDRAELDKVDIRWDAQLAARHADKPADDRSKHWFGLLAASKLGAT